MKYAQMRDGRYTVTLEGDWIGTLQQLPSGNWFFMGRLSMDAYGCGVSPQQAIYNALRDGNGEAIEVLKQVQQEVRDVGY